MIKRDEDFESTLDISFYGQPKGSIPKSKSWLEEWICEMEDLDKKDAESLKLIESSKLSAFEKSSKFAASKEFHGSSNPLCLQKSWQAFGNDEDRDFITSLLSIGSNKESFVVWFSKNFDSKKEKDFAICYSPFSIELCLKLCLEHKLFEEFTKLFRSSCSSFPVSSELKWSYIEILRRKKDHKECIRMLNDWIKGFPKSAQAWEIKCKQEVLMESFSEALLSNEQWLSYINRDLSMDVWTCLYYRSFILSQMKNWNESLKICETIQEQISKAGLSEKDLWKSEIKLLQSEGSQKSAFRWGDFCYVYYICLFETKKYSEYLKRLKDVPNKLMELHPKYEHLRFYECLANQALQRYGDSILLWKSHMNKSPQRADFINQFLCWDHFCLENYPSFYECLNSMRSKAFVHPLDSLCLIAESIGQTFDRFHHDSVQQSLSCFTDWIPQPNHFHREGLLECYGNWDSQFWFFEDSSMNRMIYWKQWILQAWGCYFLFSGYPWISWFLFSQCDTVNKSCFRAVLMSLIDLGVSGRFLLPVIQKEDRLKFTNAKHPLDRFLWTRYIYNMGDQGKNRFKSNGANVDTSSKEIIDLIQNNVNRKNSDQDSNVFVFQPLIERWVQENPDYPRDKIDPFKFLFRININREDWKSCFAFDEWDQKIECLNFHPSEKIEMASFWKKHIYVPHLKPCLNREGLLQFEIDRCIMLRSQSWSTPFFQTYHEKKDERFKLLMKNPQTSSILLNSLRSILSKDTTGFVPSFSSSKESFKTKEFIDKETENWKTFFSSFSSYKRKDGWTARDLPDMRKYYRYIFGDVNHKSDKDKPFDLDEFWEAIEIQKYKETVKDKDPKEIDQEIRFLQKTIEEDWKSQCLNFSQTPKFFTDYPMKPFWIVLEESWLESEVSPLASSQWKEILEKGIEHWLQTKKDTTFIYFSLRDWFQDHPVRQHKKFVLLYGAMIHHDNFRLESLSFEKKVQFKDQTLLLLMVLYCNR